MLLVDTSILDIAAEGHKLIHLDLFTVACVLAFATHGLLMVLHDNGVWGLPILLSFCEAFGCRVQELYGYCESIYYLTHSMGVHEFSFVLPLAVDRP